MAEDKQIIETGPATHNAMFVIETAVSDVLSQRGIPYPKYGESWGHPGIPKTVVSVLLNAYGTPRDKLGGVIDNLCNLGFWDDRFDLHPGRCISRLRVVLVPPDVRRRALLTKMGKRLPEISHGISVATQLALVCASEPDLKVETQDLIMDATNSYDIILAELIDLLSIYPISQYISVLLAKRYTRAQIIVIEIQQALLPPDIFRIVMNDRISLGGLIWANQVREITEIIREMIFDQRGFYTMTLNEVADLMGIYPNGFIGQKALIPYFREAVERELIPSGVGINDVILDMRTHPRYSVGVPQYYIREDFAEACLLIAMETYEDVLEAEMMSFQLYAYENELRKLGRMDLLATLIELSWEQRKALGSNLLRFFGRGLPKRKIGLKMISCGWKVDILPELILRVEALQLLRQMDNNEDFVALQAAFTSKKAYNAFYAWLQRRDRTSEIINLRGISRSFVPSHVYREYLESTGS